MMRMKQILLGLLSLAALASCSIKDDLQPDLAVGRFRATLEQPTPDVSTKAFATHDVDAKKYHIYWNADDRVSIFEDDTFNREFRFKGKDGAASGSFTRVGSDPGQLDANPINTPFQYAVYPYRDTNACDQDGTLTVQLPSNQDFYNDKRGVGARMLMVARAEDGDFSFKHIGSYVGITLKGAGVRVASISFQGNNSETLAGAMAITFNNNNEPIVNFIPNDESLSDVITMAFEEPVTLSSEEQEFWLVLPSITLSKGYTMTVMDPDGGVFQKITSESVTLNRKGFRHCRAEVEMSPVPLDEFSYAKASTITVGEKYIIVDVDDQRVFTGAKSGSYESVSPVDGVITGETLAAYEFTVEQSGSNYYLKFNDGNYLVCDYGSSGDGQSGLRYVASQSAVTYPYKLTVKDGAFEFNTTQMSSTSNTNQVLYYKPASAGGTGPDRFKIGGSGVGVGVHLYMKGGKQDRGLKFEPEEVICLEGQTPEKPELSGTYTTVRYSSDNTAVATVDGSGNVTVVGIGTTTITAEADEDTRYLAGMASYTLTVLDSSTASYVKAASITVGGTYVIVDVDDQRLFKGATDGSFLSVSPENGVIIDYDRTLSAYEFTVEQNGSNYYLKFNDGKYLVCDYGSSGDSTTGLRYVATQSAATYPYALTVKDGAFEFNTTQMTSTGSTNQVLYFKTPAMGNSGTNRFKIGGSGVGIGVHLYLKGGKQDRGLKFSPESVTCFQGNIPEKPELSGIYSTVRYSSDNASVASVNATNGTVTVNGIGTATITATVDADNDYLAGTASYTLTVLDPNGSSYAKVPTLTVGGTYLIVDVSDQRLFKGAKDGSYVSVSPENGVIIDHDRTLSAYEFTVEQNGSNYYLKFNDGNYLVCDYGSSGDGQSGLRYVASQSAVTYPYKLTVKDGAFEFNTTQMSSTSNTNQVLYYKPASAGGTGPDRFKIGGSGVGVGVHLYLKGGASKKTQTLTFSQPTVTWTLGQGFEINSSYDFPQEVSGANTTVTYTSEPTGVAAIQNGKIKIVSAGSATIKATAAETDEYYGAIATYTLNIATPAPEGWQHKGSFDLENEALKAYLNEAETTYTDNNEQSVTCVAKYVSQYSSITRQDCPKPVNITWTNPASSNTVVTIYSDQSLSTMVLSPVKASANATSAEVYNLVPGRTYYYTVSENGSIWEKGDFSTTGRRRMLKISDRKASGRANNCRDLGGMVTKDKTKRIKYGYIFRGSNMDGTTTEEKTILYNDLNIRLDMDLRSGTSYISGGDNGNNSAYQPFSASQFPGMTYYNVGFSSMNDIKNDPARVKNVINKIIDTVLAEDAVYFHCYVGADRTGFFGLLIEGLLGISEADCSMDYELTSFSVVGLRGRDGSGQDHYWGSKNSDKGLALLRGQNGSTFEQKCNNYLVSIGVTQERINQFKDLVLESNN